MDTEKWDDKSNVEEGRRCRAAAARFYGCQETNKRKEGYNQEKDGGAVKKMSAPPPEVIASVDEYPNLIKAPGAFEKAVFSETVDLNKIAQKPSYLTTIKEKSLVFALWNNGDINLYYPGVIRSKIQKSGRITKWTVDFDDGVKATLESSQMIPLKIIGANTACWARGSYKNADVYEATVIGQELVNTPKGTIVKYAVSFTPDADRKEPLPTSFRVRRQLAFSEEQFQILWCKWQEEIKKNESMGSITPDSPASITSSPGKENIPIKESREKNPKKQKPEKRPRKEKPKKIPKKEDPQKNLIKESSEKNPRKENPEKIPKKESLEKNLIKESSEKSFQIAKQFWEHTNFIITPTYRKTNSKEIDRIAKIVDKHGGNYLLPLQCLDKKELTMLESDNCVLVCLSEKPARTFPYIFALAKRIMCVKKEWVIKCHKRNEVYDPQLYLAGAGMSAYTNNLHDQKPTEKPLKGLKIYLEMDNPKQQDLWKKVLEAGEAVVHRLRNANRMGNEAKTKDIFPDKKKSVVITNFTNVSVCAFAQNNKMTVVRPGWIRECLFQGRKVDWKKKCYRYFSQDELDSTKRKEELENENKFESPIGSDPGEPDSDFNMDLDNSRDTGSSGSDSENENEEEKRKKMKKSKKRNDDNKQRKEDMMLVAEVNENNDTYDAVNNDESGGEMDVEHNGDGDFSISEQDCHVSMDTDENKNDEESREDYQKNDDMWDDNKKDNEMDKNEGKTGAKKDFEEDDSEDTEEIDSEDTEEE